MFGLNLKSRHSVIGINKLMQNKICKDLNNLEIKHEKN